jgi:hypothetical protein
VPAQDLGGGDPTRERLDLVEVAIAQRASAAANASVASPMSSTIPFASISSEKKAASTT